MTKQQATEQAVTEASTPTAKEAMYVTIADHIKAKTGKRIGKTGGRELFDMVVSGVFKAAVTDGTFRFNGGHGSLHVKTYGAGSRNLPSGQKVTFGNRQKLRYEEGVEVKKMIVAHGPAAETEKTADTPEAPAETAEAGAVALDLD